MGLELGLGLERALGLGLGLGLELALGLVRGLALPGCATAANIFAEHPPRGLRRALDVIDRERVANPLLPHNEQRRPVALG